MRRPLFIFSVLVLTLLVFAACSDDTVSPDPTVVQNSGSADKRLPRISPMDFETFIRITNDRFETLQWIEVKYPMSAKTGGSVSVVPEGYPATHPITLTVAPDPLASDKVEECTLWVAAPPADGLYLGIYGNCLLYRTQNIPPAGGKTAKVDFPIMPWYRTTDYDGNFAVYDFNNDENEPLEAINMKSITVPWPPADPDRIYVEVNADADKEEPDRIIDRIIDPGQPGEPADD
jgi:hypothetical protein